MNGPFSNALGLIVSGALVAGAGAALAQPYPVPSAATAYPAPPANTPAPYPPAGMPPPGNVAGDSSTPPALPQLTSEQAANLERELAAYRRDVDDRVARGEIGEQEAARLLSWRRWQLARQIAGLVPPEPQVVIRREYVVPRYYAYDPYWYPRPYYWGPRLSVCAGGFGRHSFGSICF